jgi:hypothetical protein
MAKKTTTSSSSPKTTPAPRPTAKRTTKKPAPAPQVHAEGIPLPTLAPVTSTRDVYSLQLGTGFSLLTRLVPGGAVTASRVPAGAVLEVSYWKEPTHPAQPTARLSNIVLHARLDGVELPSVTLATLDLDGRLVRTAGRIELPESAKLLEYWFELDTEAGEKLWDSNWGNNHWVELVTLTGPGAEAQQPSLQKN